MFLYDLSCFWMQVHVSCPEGFLICIPEVASDLEVQSIWRWFWPSSEKSYGFISWHYALAFQRYCKLNSLAFHIFMSKVRILILMLQDYMR